MLNLSSDIKKWLKRKIVACGMLRACSRILPSGAVILRYHSVQHDPQDVSDTIGLGITHTTVLFKKQIEYIARHCHPVSLDDILNSLVSGKSLKAGSVAITFDDGFRDNAELAAPILDRVGIPAAFYVTTGAVEVPLAPWYIRLRKAFYGSFVEQWVKPNSGDGIQLATLQDRERGLVAACQHCAKLASVDQDVAVKAIEGSLEVVPFTPNPSIMMSWSQIKELKDTGHIIGSHTVTHPNMAYVQRKELLAELSESKKLLEDKIKAPVYHFSYPSPMLEPHWTVDTLAATKKIGYKTATTCTAGNVRTGDDPLALKRMWVPFEMDEFVWYLDNTMMGRGL